ncbi:bifunctional metallophosphatase/5'-nucleotidase [Kordiimonas gwangyangensis]|uniref:bifunctional metallophosphatase/5'-nucleotidase n=1 Tax=Kordiimonas gwangyangensis TaxID=288022 RepID=UPI0012DFDB81|nr:5'-nucleotidase C-terminal domain-containing protein [Kordiimonas gwangyangensis]
MRRYFAGLTMALVVAVSFALPSRGDDVPADALRLIYLSSLPEIVQPKDKAGLAEFATLLAKERASGREVYFIDGGASLGPSVLGALDNGAHMVDILNALAPEFMAIGKKEFAYGYDEMVVNALASAFPFVTSNLVDRQTGRQIDGTDPYFLLEGNNLTVGFIALTSVNAIVEYGATQAHALDITAVVKQTTDELRELGAHAVFLMADTDFDDLGEFRASGIVDGIFYTHNFGNPHSLDHQGVLHTEGPLDGKAIILDIWQDDTGALQTAASFPSLANYVPDENTARLIASYRDRLSERLSPPIATISTSFDTLRQNVRTSENAFGNFIADALRYHLKADAVLLNSGAIRGNRSYTAGEQLSRGDIQRELPFGNRTALLKLKGADLVSALEHGLDCARSADGCALQVSNLTVEFDSSAPKGNRVQRVLLDTKAVDSSQYYLVGVSDFMAAGNDGYYMLTNAERVAIRHTNRAMWDLVAERAEKLGEIAPKTEGRLKDMSKKTQDE